MDTLSTLRLLQRQRGIPVGEGGNTYYMALIGAEAIGKEEPHESEEI